MQKSLTFLFQLSRNVKATVVLHSFVHSCVIYAKTMFHPVSAALEKYHALLAKKLHQDKVAVMTYSLTSASAHRDRRSCELCSTTKSHIGKVPGATLTISPSVENSIRNTITPIISLWTFITAGQVEISAGIDMPQITVRKSTHVQWLIRADLSNLSGDGQAQEQYTSVRLRTTCYDSSMAQICPVRCLAAFWLDTA